MSTGQFSVGAFSQVLWPQVGDVDDCWALADLMAVHAVAPWLYLPMMTAYRAAAGNPDLPGPTPGSIDNSVRAIHTLFPKLAIVAVKDTEFWPAFSARMKADHPVSLSVLSGSLPANMQYGYTGAHRITAWWQANENTFRILNPLAAAFSRGQNITEAALQKAVADHPLSGIHAVVLPTVEEAFTTHPLYVAPADCTDKEKLAREAGYSEAKSKAEAAVSAI